ncbi:hypothetical protein GCM10009715_10650 [Paeniglutamicibacter psychrophenolicus]|uniref:Uncharacterized protein n=1 Tax=Paeniglutamicibacter psychrophenolicus TaxID=257454 RepID=A0ABS4WG25_9MICC|nr:hypothetical protein [Paeniglutamicibacter psychrophenolicus]MBP2375165.1 hypothetical protein [Paeniglutamicibacter psychrophenolicus]
MIIQLPARNHLAAAELAGTLRRTQGAAERVRGVLVLKAAYDLLSGASGSNIPVPAATGEAAAIAYADLPATAAGTFEAAYEADIAPEKARSDIVVAGWVLHSADGTGVEGDVEVNGVTWMQRRVADETVVPAPGDARRNLFGWLPRSTAPRALQDLGGDADSPLPAAYHARFNNFSHRAGESGPPVYATPGDHNTIPLPAGALVTVRQQTHGDAGSVREYAFLLPDSLQYTVRLRAYCGHGPDAARHWKVAGLVPLQCDTLIVRPQQRRMLLLWRAEWDPETEPAANWRMLQVLEGSH